MVIILITEEELFLKGIKPAILYQNIKNNNFRNKIHKMYSSKEFKIIDFKDDILITRNSKFELKTENLGYILGYFPKSVDSFMSKNPKRRIIKNQSVFINYNGIHFNTMEYFDEALEWCHEMYRKNMLKTFGKIEVYKQIFYMDNEAKVKDILNKQILFINLKPLVQAIQ